jgi:hypothetical protein
MNSVYWRKSNVNDIEQRMVATLIAMLITTILIIILKVGEKRD